MVVFICGSCNESLKKNSVSIHLNRCRAPVISCCDCNKEFSDNSYQSHNQCISESSKYGPESQRVFGNNDKGKIKQDVWLDKIREALKTMKLSGRAEMALNKLLEYPNIPRKHGKFQNFISSCLHIDSPELIDQLWNICETANKAAVASGGDSKSVEKKVQPQPKETTSPSDGVTEDSKSGKKDKKKKKKKNEEETESGVTIDKTEEPNETQGTENSGQSNGINDSGKKSKKKLKKADEEEKQETQETNGNGKDNMETEQNESISEPVPQLDEEEAENEGEKSKKKPKKKKKRSHSETEENEKSNGQVDGDSNENEQRKKSKPDDEDDSILDEKTEQDLSTIEVMISELKNDPDNQIGWFKQLKRQIKEKKTVDLKEFKKMIKRLKKEHELDEKFTDLITKAKTKLMKRHNYSVSEGQIQYNHLF